MLKVVAPVTSEGVSSERVGDGPVPVRLRFALSSAANTLTPMTPQIHADLTMFASLLPASAILSHSLLPKTKSAYLHLVQSSGYRGPSSPPDPKAAQLRIDDLLLEEGDSVLVQVGKAGARELRVESTGKREAEWVLVEME